MSAASVNNNNTTTTTTTATHKRTKSAPRMHAGPLVSSLLLTNLRLLDLDLLPDWPSITPSTFSNVDARARIKAAEWSLYQLFRLFDPAVTAEKLQPFFPPLEPLQSINLRAALYRCLDGLKKNGVLGRETVLRKTMLDECSGDKFWEICVVFSALVVRKRVVRKKDKMGLGRPLAQTLGAAQGLRKADREALLPLLVAHRVSLNKNLVDKQRLGEEFAQLGNVLQEKEQDLGRRRAVLQDNGKHDQVQKQLEHFKPLEDVLRKGWVGDEGFEEALLSGGSAASSDRMLAESTEALFSRDRRSRVSILGQDEPEITEDIVSKARGQNSRLKRWQALYDRLQAAKPKLSQADEARVAGQTVAIRFNRHADLTLGDNRSQGRSSSPVKNSHTRAASACVTGYDNILSAMREDLRLTQNARRNDQGSDMNNDARHGRSASAVTGVSRTSSFQSSHNRHHSRSPSMQHSPSHSPAPFRPGIGRRISSRSRSYQQPKVISQRGPIPLKTELFSPLKSARPGNESPTSGFMSRPSSHLPSPQEEVDESTASIDGTLNNNDRFGSSRNGEYRQATPVLPPPQEETDESMGGIDGALSGLGISDANRGEVGSTPNGGNAPNFDLPTSSASPVNLDPPKQDPIADSTELVRPALPTRQPSLANRTRLSMAFTSSNNSSTPEDSPSPTINPDNFPLPPSASATSSPQTTRSLADRTRQSISSSTPVTRQRPTQHTRSQTSIHQHPNTTPRAPRRLSFDQLTPSREADEAEGQTGSSANKRIFTPREHLFDEGVEYDSVFKSRPKVAHSPLMSPSAPGYDDDEEEEFSMVGALRELDDEGELGSSPLRR